MTRFLSVLRWDVTLQYRYKFYGVSVFIVAFWAGIFSLFPAIGQSDGALAVPAFFVINLNTTTFYFIAALVLLERAEGIHTALATSPLRDFEYLLSRVLSLTFLATVETALVVVIILGGKCNWGLLFLGGIQLGVVYTLIGFILVLPYDSINAFLMPSVIYVTLLLLPLVEHFGGLSQSLFYIHPVEPALVLMRAAYQPVSSGHLVYGAVGGLFWVVVCFVVARKRYEAYLVRQIHV